MLSNFEKLGNIRVVLYFSQWMLCLKTVILLSHDSSMVGKRL